MVEEDEENEDLIETNYCNGTNEVVKIFNQRCVLCYEKDSVFMPLDNVVTNAFVNNVIRIEEILIY